MTCTRSRCCPGWANASWEMPPPTVTWPSRSAGTPTRRRSRRCSSGQGCPKSRYSISQPGWSRCIAATGFDRIGILEDGVMGKWLLGLCIALLCGALAATDAEARRLGGSRSVGTQRNVTPPPVSTPAKPAQQPAAQPAGSRWMPILGGLALGGLLGYLFGGSGLGGGRLLALLGIGEGGAVAALARPRGAGASPAKRHAAGLG